MGELAFEGEPDTFKERVPLRVWGRIGAMGALSDADADADGGRGALFVDESRVAVGDVSGGVVDSAWPVMERKEPAVSAVSVVSGMMVKVLGAQW
jgi:hypothetical protein